MVASQSVIPIYDISLRYLCSLCVTGVVISLFQARSMLDWKSEFCKRSHRYIFNILRLKSRTKA